MNLLGKVRSITYTEYEASTDSVTKKMVKGKVSKSYTDANYTAFNKEGNKTLEIFYNVDNTLDTKDSLIYDSINRLKEVYTTKSGGTKYRSVYTYTNNLTEIIKYRSNGSVYFKRIIARDAKHNIIEQKEFDDKGRPADHIICKRDYTRGVMYQTTATLKGITNRQGFKYDLNYNIIKKSWLNAEGYPDEEMLIKYDKNNNTTEIDNYDSHGVLTSKYKYKYTFDESGNWITCTVYKDDKPKFFKERKIEYFQ